MRSRRSIRSKKMYDLCFRAQQGLPFPARSLTVLLMESIMARLVRMQDAIICNYVWMGNHVHMQAYSLDAQALVDFYGGLKKQLTDFIKRLLGVNHLNLWEDRATVAEVLDLEAAISRVIYGFLNPMRALGVSIDTYKGCNTWKEFLSAAPNLDSVIEKEVPWIHATDLAKLSSPNPSLREEQEEVERLRMVGRNRTHTLRIYPFKWLAAFKISDPKEIERIRGQIVAAVRAEELKLARTKAPKERLEGYVITAEHRPKKKERKVFVYGSTKEIRIEYLKYFGRFLVKCRECYELMKQGVRSIDWPAECFIPPAPKLCNAF